MNDTLTQRRRADDTSHPRADEMRSRRSDETRRVDKTCVQDVDSLMSRRRLVEIPGCTHETASFRRPVLVVQMTMSNGLCTC
jgi:hypothetical protein